MALNSAIFAESSGTLWSVFLVKGSCHARAQTASRGKFSRHRSALRTACLHDVAQKAVHHVLLKNSQIAIRQRVHLERFQLQAQLVRHVPDRDGPEVGKRGLRTYRREFRNRDLDLVTRELIRPRFDRGQGRVDSRRRMFICVGFFHSPSSRESNSRNSPTSVTTPTACPVPRSLTLVATAGLMSTHTIFTQLGSMFPVAIECSIEPRQITRPADFK